MTKHLFKKLYTFLFIQYSCSPNGGNTWKSLDAHTIDFIHTVCGFEAETEITCQIAAVNRAGRGTYAANGSATTPPCTG